MSSSSIPQVSESWHAATSQVFKNKGHGAGTSTRVVFRKCHRPFFEALAAADAIPRLDDRCRTTTLSRSSLEAAWGKLA